MGFRVPLSPLDSFGGLLLAFGTISFKSGIPHGTALGVVAAIAGHYLGFTAIRWNDE